MNNQSNVAYKLQREKNMFKKYTLFVAIIWMLFQPSEPLFASLGTKVRICSVKGTVTTQLVGGKKCYLKQNMKETECRVINQSVIVETGPDSYAIIEYYDLGKVKLAPNTKVRVEGRNIYTTITEDQGLIFFIDGFLWAGFSKDVEYKFNVTKKGLIIKTPTAIAGIRGTEFLVEVADDGTSTFSLIEGKLEISDIDKQKTVMLTTGMEVKVQAGLPPSIPAPLNIKENDKWWTDWPTLIPIADAPPNLVDIHDPSSIGQPNFSNAVGKPCAPDKEFVLSLYHSVVEYDLEVSFATGYGGAHMRSLQNGDSRLVTILAFFNSPGYLDKQKSGHEFMRDAYQAVLGREPSATEINQWPRITRNDIIKRLFNSNEYRNLMASCPGIGQQIVGTSSLGTAWLLTASSNLDMVGRNENFRGDGKTDAIFRAQFSAPNRTVTAVEVSNTNGLRSVWDTRPNNRLWLGGVVIQDRTMSRSDGSVNFSLGSDQNTLDFFVEDNGSISGGKTNYRMTIFFASGDPLVMNIIPGSGSPEIGQQIVDSSSITGEWYINQYNGYNGTINLQQDQSGRLTGTANWNQYVNGVIEGKISGNAIEFKISYPNGDYGFYKGTLAQNGTKIVNGTVNSKNGTFATWDALHSSVNINVSGQWYINQYNGYNGTINLQQDQSGRLTGTAIWNQYENGIIEGKISGNTIEFKISYPNGDYGFYKGALTQNGAKIVNGIHNAKNGATASWDALR